MSKKNFIFYLFIVGLPLIYGCHPVIESDFYLPKNYSGEVAIIYNYSKGNKEIIKWGKFQFIIPDSGILFTQTPLKYGNVDEKFYLKKDKGFEKLIPYTFQKDSLSKIYISNNRIETIICLDKNGKSVEYSIQFFSVGRINKEIDSVVNKNSFLFSKHVKQLLGCE